MKFFNKKFLFFICMLLNYGENVFGYTYKIFNKTGRKVKVQLSSAVGKLNKNAKTIESGSPHKFVFGGIKSRLCLSKITVSMKERDKWTKSKKVEMRLPAGRLTWAGCSNRRIELFLDSKTRKVYAEVAETDWIE